MRISFLIIITSLYSCQTDIPDETSEMSSKVEPCETRPHFQFEKVTTRLDSTFKLFVEPIDSIDKLINSKNIRPLQLPYMSDTTAYKRIWYNNGGLIKIENHLIFYGRPIYHSYYVQDKCHWFYEREEYHESQTDSLIHCDLFYYRDTTILNAFIGAALNECAFLIRADSNRFSIDKAEKVRGRFISELECYAR